MPVAGSPAAREVRGYHKPIMIAGGLGNIRAEHVQKARDPAGARRRSCSAARRCSSASAAARPRRSRRARARGPRFRVGAARQRRDAAALPGGHRPLLGARRREPDPLHPRRRRGRPLERAARARATTAGAARVRPARGPERRARHVAARALVQRGAGALRARARARRTSARSRRSARASAARSPCSATRRTTAGSSSTIAHFANRPIDLPLEVLLGKPPRMTRDARDAAVARRAVRRRGRRRARGGAAPAAPAHRRRQDVPHHHRRPHRRRPRSRAIRWSARGRCRWPTPPSPRRASTASPARRWRWASARRWRCWTPPPRRAWRSARRITNLAAAPVGEALGREAVGELDGAPPATPARTRASTTPCAPSAPSSAPPSASPSPSARTRCRCARVWQQDGETRSGDRAAVARRQRLRAGHGRAPDAHAGAACATSSDTVLLLVDLGRRQEPPRRLVPRPGLRPARRHAARSRRPGALVGFFAARAASSPTRGRCSRTTTAPTAACSSRSLEMAFAGRIGLGLDVGPLRAGRRRARAPWRRCSPRSSARSSRCAPATSRA